MLQINVCAADKINLDFDSASKSKFIYCNNPENVTKDDLADTTYNNNPTLLMKQDIQKGNYDLFVSLRNMIDKIDLSKKSQEKLYVDVEFCNDSKNDLVLKVNRLGYQIPQSAMQLEPVSRYRNDVSWSCLNAYSDYLQKKFNAQDFIQDGKYDFVTHIPKPLPQIFKDNIVIKPGQNFWLLGDSQNERPGMLAGQVFLLLNNFEVVSGNGVAKIAAFVDINNYSSNCTDSGKFITDVRDNVKSYRYYKGLADSSRVLETNLEYDVDDDTQSNIYLPIAIKNQFTEGDYAVTNNWITNLNPCNKKDEPQKVSESDMFKFIYPDKNQVWYFDTHHTDFPNKFVDNANDESYCNLGNWGATNRYNIKINNNSCHEQKLEYYIKSDSDFILETGNEVKIRSHIDTKENLQEELNRYYNGDIEEYKKFLAEKKIPFTLKSENDFSANKVLEFVIPSKQSKTISFDVTLCTNCEGHPQNSLRLVKQDTSTSETAKIKNIKLNYNAHRVGFAQNLQIETNASLPKDSIVKASIYKKDGDKQKNLLEAVSQKCDGSEAFKSISFESCDLNKLSVGDYGIKISILDLNDNILASHNFDNVYKVSDGIVISSANIENLDSLSITPDKLFDKLKINCTLNGLQNDDKIISGQANIINLADKLSDKMNVESTDIKLTAHGNNNYSFEMDWPKNLPQGNYNVQLKFCIKNNSAEKIVSDNTLRIFVCDSIDEPTLNLNKKVYNEPQYLRLESKNNNDIYYKLNDGNWTLYKSPIKIECGKTNLKAFCTDNDFYTGARSNVLYKEYIVQSN